MVRRFRDCCRKSDGPCPQRSNDMRHGAAILVIALAASNAFADMAPLVSYKKELVNNKFLLVMLYPKENSLNGENPLHKIYTKSGLYLNDGSRDPIWTLD